MNRAKNILVVDDEELIHNLIKRCFRRTHHNVLCAFDGKRGIELFRQRSPNIDLVLLDIMLPGPKGIDFLDDYKQINSSTPIIIITGYPTMEYTLRALSRGACDFVSKPFDVQTIEEKEAVVTASIDSNRIEITVTDEGDGFDYRKHLDFNNVFQDQRGLYLILSFMDKVVFNERGNAITMVKYRNVTPADAIPAVA